jgi:hypothetical protein
MALNDYWRLDDDGMMSCCRLVKTNRQSLPYTVYSLVDNEDR